jgi:transposase
MSQMKRKRYSAEFKARAVELIKMGRPVAEVAEELGVGYGILYRWSGGVSELVQLEGEATSKGSEPSEADLAKELRRLRRDYARLQMENDILKKAAVILGTNLPPDAGK